MRRPGTAPASPAPPTSPEERLIRRTARRIALQTAALFTVAIIAIIAIAAVLVLRTQQNDAQRLLDQAIADNDAVTNPPSGFLIFQSTGDGPVQASTTLTGGRPIDPDAFAVVRAGGTAGTRSVELDERHYLVATGHRGAYVVQAALDLRDQEAERDRLINALFAAGVVGLVMASMVGWLIARRAIRPLGVAIERQRRFVADASHELRTPVTQVHTRAQLLRRALAEKAADPALAADADRLVRGTRQLGDILGELLESAQLRAEPALTDVVDLGVLAVEAVDAEQPRAAEAGIALTLRRDAGPHLVSGSRPALGRVLNSLIDNALGHTSSGGHVEVDVGIDGDRTRERVTCAVTDDGVGFEPDQTDLLFERFVRGSHGTGRRYGLGLALVREVVDAHRGTVTAHGRPGGGATFRVTLPARRDGQPPPG